MQMAVQEILALLRLDENLKIAVFSLYFFEGLKLNAKGTSTLRYQACPVSCLHAISTSCPSQTPSYTEQSAATNSQAHSVVLLETALSSLLDQILPSSQGKKEMV